MGVFVELMSVCDSVTELLRDIVGECECVNEC